MTHKPNTSILFWLLLSILVPLLIYWRWFFTANIYSWGDWGFLYQETSQDISAFPQAWSPTLGIGGYDISLSQYFIFHSVQKALSFLPNSSLADRFTYMVPSIIFSSVGMFLLVKRVTKHNLGALIGALFYTFNTYILILNTGHLTLASSFAFAPLIFMLFQKMLAKKSVYYLFFTVLMSMASIVYDVRGFYIIALILGIYTLYELFRLSNHSSKTILGLLGWSILPFLILILLNLYWLVPSLFSLSSFEGIALNRQFYGADQSIFPRPFTLYVPFWTGTHKLAWGTIQRIPIYFWFLPVAILISFWANRKNNQMIFWFGIALLGMFLLKMTGDPFTGVYKLLFDHFPGFNAFRESSKFYVYVALGYSVLLGGFVSWVWQNKIRTLFKIGVTALIVSFIMFNTRGVIAGDVGRLLTPRHPPQDYLILKDFIINQPDFFRTLCVPICSKWGYFDSLHPRLSLYHTAVGEWFDLNDYHQTGLDYSRLDLDTGIFKKPFANKLLDETAVKYIYVIVDDVDNEDYLYPLDATPSMYVHFLDSLAFLTRIDIGMRDLVIYENKDYKPHLFIDNQSDLVIIQQSSPTRYVLQLNPTSTTTDLVFSENFHPGWKIKVGQFNWWESLFNKDYFLPDTLHTKSDMGLNVFTLAPHTQEQVTLYFAPQAWVNVGMIVVFITLITCLATLWLARKS